MNSEQINLVQISFGAVRPIAAVTAERFYKRLFEHNPGLQSVFANDLAHQGRVLMALLSAAVNGLSRMETLAPTVRMWVSRQSSYGINEADYVAFASALLWALEQGLGARFTPATRDAWTAAYELLAGSMKMGAMHARVSDASSA